MASQGMLQLFTAIDERSAAFLALGMATAAGRSVAVVTTSGTAVANLLPAAVEADRSCQPLLLLTASRRRGRSQLSAAAAAHGRSTGTAQELRSESDR